MAASAARTSAGIPSSTASTSGSTKLTRGAAIASSIGIPKSMRFITICGTVWPIVCPPGVPTAAHGRLLRRMIVGQSPDSFRRPGNASIGLPLGSNVE